MAFLAALARRAQSAQRLPPRNVGEASPPVAGFRPSHRPKVNRAAAGLFAFKAAQAGYGADRSGKFDEAVGKVSIAVRLAPGNSRYLLVLLINALFSTSRLAEADQAVTAAVGAGGESSALAQQRIAIAQRRAHVPGAASFAALERKDTASAIANARSAILLAPGDSAYEPFLV